MVKQVHTADASISWHLTAVMPKTLHPSNKLSKRIAIRMQRHRVDFKRHNQSKSLLYDLRQTTLTLRWSRRWRRRRWPSLSRCGSGSRRRRCRRSGSWRPLEPRKAPVATARRTGRTRRPLHRRKITPSVSGPHQRETKRIILMDFIQSVGHR